MKLALLALATSAMKIKVGVDQESQWGFLKNIVNIDRFFSSGDHTPSDATFVQLSVSPADQETLDAQSKEIEDLLKEVEDLTKAEEELNRTHQENQTAIMNELDAGNKPLRDELQARRDILQAKEQEAKDAKEAKDANSPPILDLDAHSYPAVKSFFARDDHWVEGTPGPDGYPVDILKFPAGVGENKYKGWEFTAVPEGVTHVRVNFYYKLLKEVLTEGDDFGIKFFGTNQGAEAMRECGVGNFCWISLVGTVTNGDAGFIKLSANSVKSAFEAEIK